MKAESYYNKDLFDTNNKNIDDDEEYENEILDTSNWLIYYGLYD